MAEQTVVMRLEVTSGGSVRVLRDTADGLEGVGRAAKQAAKDTEGELSKISGLFGNLKGEALSVQNAMKSIGQVALGLGLAVSIQSAAQAFRDLVEQSVQYAISLEQSRLTIAALLQGTTQLRSSSGDLVEPSKAWTLNLQEAEGLQERIAELNLVTLGSQQDLQDVFASTLAYSRGQVTNLDKQLEVSKGLLNLGKLLGLEGARQEAEVRQIFELNSAMGQQTLAILGVNIDQARNWKTQGILVDELIKRLEVYNALADSISTSWEGLTSTAESFRAQISAIEFEGVFGALKEILIGANAELKLLKEQAKNNPIEVNVDQKDLRATGALLADIWEWMLRISAKTVTVVIEQVNNLRQNTVETGIGGGGLGADVVKALGEAWVLAKEIIVAAAHIINGIYHGLVQGVNLVYVAYLTLIGAAEKAQKTWIYVLEEGRRGVVAFAAAFGIQLGETKQKTAELTGAAIALAPALDKVNDSATRGAEGLKLNAEQMQRVTEASARVIQLARESASQLAVIDPSQNVRAVTQLNLQIIELERQKNLAASQSAQERLLVEQQALAQQGQAAVQEADLFMAQQRQKLKVASESASARGAIEQANSQRVIAGLQQEIAILGQRSSFLATQVGTEEQRSALIQRRLVLEQQVAAAQSAGARAQATAARENITAQQQLLAALQAQRAAQAATLPPGEGRDLTLAKISQEIVTVSNQLEQERAKVIQFTTQAATEFAKIAALKVQADTEFIKGLNEQAAASAELAQQRVAILEAQQEREQARTRNQDQRLAAEIQTEQARLGLMREEGVRLRDIGAQLALIITKEKERAQLAVQEAQERVGHAQEALQLLQDEADALDVLIAKSQARGVVSAELQAQQKSLAEDIAKAEDRVVDAQGSAAVATQRVKTAAIEGATAWSQYNKELVKTAALTKNELIGAFENALSSSGNLIENLGDELEGLGRQAGTKLFSGLLFGKQKELDEPLIGNINDLVGGADGGLLGQLFNQGGSSLAGMFGDSFLGSVKGDFSNGYKSAIGEMFDASSVQWTQAGSAGGSQFGGGFLSSLKGLFGGAGGSGGGFAGALGLGSAFAGIGKSFSEGNYGAGSVGVIGGAIGGYFGGTQGAALGAQLGQQIGGIFDSIFNQKTRISTETKKLTKFFEKVFDGLDFKVIKESAAAKGFAAYKDSADAALALGALYAESIGKKANQGTIVRFAGQLLGNFEKMGYSAEQVKEKLLEMSAAMSGDLTSSLESINSLMTQYSKTQKGAVLSLSEFEEEMEEARKNLKKYGDTSELTAKQLSDLAVANGNTGSKIVTYGELVGDAIDLAAGFNEAINGQVVAADLLSRKFTEVVKAQGTLGAESEALAAKIKDGTLSVEEAILELNRLRESAGQTALALTDFAIDPEVVQEVVEQLLAIAETFDSFFERVGEGLATSLIEGLTGTEAADDFEVNFKKMLATGMSQAIVAATKASFEAAPIGEYVKELSKLFGSYAAGQVTQDEFSAQLAALREKYGPTVDEFKQKIKETVDAGHDLLDTFGLLPEQIEEAKTKTEDLVSKIQALNEAIISLGQQRIQLRIDVASQLASIEAITGQQANAFRREVVSGELATLLTGSISSQLASTLGREVIARFTPAVVAVAGLAEAFNAPLASLQQFESSIGERIVDAFTGPTRSFVDLATLFNVTTSQYTQAQEAATRRLGSVTGAAVDVLGDEAPLRVSQFSHLTDSMLERAIVLTGQLRETAVERYNVEKAAIEEQLQGRIEAINDAAKLEQEAIRADFAARREAAQEQIAGLQRAKTDTSELYASQLASLRTLLAVAQDFANAADQAKRAVTQLVVGSETALSRPEQAEFLERQEATLRAQLEGAPAAKQPEIIREIIANLQQQLQSSPYQEASLDYFRQFNDTLAKIEALQDLANEGAKNAPSLEQQILDVQISQKAALEKIDLQIQAAQAQAAALSQQEQEALKASQEKAAADIVAAQDEAKESIEVMRKEVANEIVRLAVLENQLMGEQEQRLLEQKALAEAQLVELVGAEEAQKLIAVGNNAMVIQLSGIQNVLGSIDQHIVSFLQGAGEVTTPAPSGNAGQNAFAAFALAASNSFLVQPVNQGTTRQTVSLAFNPVITLGDIRGRGTDPGDLRRTARDIWQAVEDEAIESVETGRLGRAIQAVPVRGY